MGDQDRDSFVSSIMLKNIDNQIPIAFDEATPSKTTTPTTKIPSSLIGKESYKDKKSDQPATNHLKQEPFHEIKHYMSCLQKHNKTDYMNEYIKAIQDQIASLKSGVMFLRGEVKEKNAFIEQLNNNNNNNNNNNINTDINNNNNNNNSNNNNNNNIINRNNNNNSNNDDNNILHKTSNSPPNISNNNNSSNVLNDIDNDNNNSNNNNNNKNNDNNNKNSKFFSNNKSSSSKNNNGNVVATDKTNDSNITFRRNLKNIAKFTITITTIIVIVIIMKTITTIKAVVIIKLILLHRHQPQKKLFSYLETAW